MIKFGLIENADIFIGDFKPLIIIARGNGQSMYAGEAIQTAPLEINADEQFT